MLTHLYIANYALIEEVSIDFRPGFTAITGETGAGKSILMGALATLLSPRPDVKKALRPAKKTIVEATFGNPSPQLQALFKEADLEWDPQEIILRREFPPSGRSRAYVNDSPVPASLLVDITTRLLDIHSQHQNISLLDKTMQLDILDTIAGNADLVARYKSQFQEYVSMRNTLRTLKEQQLRERQNLDSITFRLTQLRELNPKPGELEELERELQILSGAEAISLALQQAVSLLSSSDHSVVPTLQKVQATLRSTDLVIFGDQASDLYPRLESATIEIQDMAHTLSQCLDRTKADPVRLQYLEERIHALYHAQTVFRVSGHDALINLLTELEQRYNAATDPSDGVGELRAKLRDAGEQLKLTASELSRTRQQAAETLTSQLPLLARPLGLPHLQFQIQLATGALTPDGQDTPALLAAFNKNQPLKPVKSHASGGEISRLMLSLKAILSRHTGIPTLILDEIDTGVSGSVAAAMAQLMHDIGENAQLLAITHLPQIAAKASAHIKVYKQDTHTGSNTHIIPLDTDGRVLELARLLGGSRIDEAATQNARSLMGLKH